MYTLEVVDVSHRTLVDQSEHIAVTFNLVKGKEKIERVLAFPVDTEKDEITLSLQRYLDRFNEEEAGRVAQEKAREKRLKVEGNVDTLKKEIGKLKLSPPKK